MGLNLTGGPTTITRPSHDSVPFLKILSHRKSAMIVWRNGYTPGDHQYLVGTGVTVLFVWRTIMLEMLGSAASRRNSRWGHNGCNKNSCSIAAGTRTN